MIKNITKLISHHIKVNLKIYFILILVSFIGLIFGAVSVRVLDDKKYYELVEFLKSFLLLFDIKNVDNYELFKISFIKNFELVVIFWVLGVSIIGIPVIVVINFVRSYVVGFSLGFLLSVSSLQGLIFLILIIVLKEMFIMPSFWALSVNGIKFSLGLMGKFSGKARKSPVNSLKTEILLYTILTGIFSILIFLGVLIESYVTPFLLMYVKFK